MTTSKYTPPAAVSDEDMQQKESELIASLVDYCKRRPDTFRKKDGNTYGDTYRLHINHLCVDLRRSDLQFGRTQYTDIKVSSADIEAGFDALNEHHRLAKRQKRYAALGELADAITNPPKKDTNEQHR